MIYTPANSLAEELRNPFFFGLRQFPAVVWKLIFKSKAAVSMPEWKQIFFTGLLLAGVILLSMEVIELITGVPYFGGYGILGWPCFLGWVAERERTRKQ